MDIYIVSGFCTWYARCIASFFSRFFHVVCWMHLSSVSIVCYTYIHSHMHIISHINIHIYIYRYIYTNILICISPFFFSRGMLVASPTFSKYAALAVLLYPLNSLPNFVSLLRSMFDPSPLLLLCMYLNLFPFVKFIADAVSLAIHFVFISVGVCSMHSTT